MNKKNIIIVVINILIAIVLYLFLFVIVSQIKYGNIKINFNNHFYKIDDAEINSFSEPYPENFKRLDFDNSAYVKYCGEERFLFGENYISNPVVVMGGSYAYGHGIKKAKTFPAILSSYIKRPVYSFAECGGDAVFSLNLMKEIINKQPELKEYFYDTEYVVYVYMYNHIARYIDPENLNPRYNNLFKYSNFEKIIMKSEVLHYIYKRIKQNIIMYGYPNCENSCKFLKKVIMRWYKEMREYTPNAQYIIILYDEKIADTYSKDSIYYYRKIMENHIWKEIEEETGGQIKVVHSEDITGFVFDKNYKLNADIKEWHPDEKAWEVLTPLFADKYIK